MLRVQPARSATCALKRCQQYSLAQCAHFSSSTRAAAISPYRNLGHILPSKQPKEIFRREQSTAAQPASYVLICLQNISKGIGLFVDFQSQSTKSGSEPSVQSRHGTEQCTSSTKCPKARHGRIVSDSALVPIFKSAWSNLATVSVSWGLVAGRFFTR